MRRRRNNDYYRTTFFQRLKEYREQANRELFILPEGKTIDLLSKKLLDNKNLEIYIIYILTENIKTNTHIQ
jgi:hypothetical protein